MEDGRKKKKEEQISISDKKIPGKNAEKAGTAVYSSYTGFSCSCRKNYIH